MDQFHRFLRDPSSVSPLTPRSYLIHFITTCTDVPKLMNSLPALLSTSKIPDSLRSILRPNREAPEGYVSRVVGETELLRFGNSMASLLKDERKKHVKTESSLDRWLRAKHESSGSVWRSQSQISCDLDSLKKRVNAKYANDEKDRKNLENFQIFKNNRNDFYLRQQRFEEAQVRAHARDLRRQLAQDKTQKNLKKTETLREDYSVRMSSDGEAQRRKLEQIAERSHKACVDRLTREHRSEIRRRDYDRALEIWKSQLLLS